MIKDVEESILSFRLSSKFLNIIKNQDIDSLIEIDEVICFVLTNRISILHREKMSRKIQNAKFWMQFLNSPSDGIHQVGFTTARWSKDKEWIESLCRILCNSFTHRTCQTIAFSLYIVVKEITLMELRIQILRNWRDGSRRSLIGMLTDWSILSINMSDIRNLNRTSLHFNYRNLIAKSHIFAKESIDGFTNQRSIIIPFQHVENELAWDRQYKLPVCIFREIGVCKERIVLLLCDVLPNYISTLIPQHFM